MTSYHECTDQQLTDLLLAGDERAFTQIFKRYNGILYTHAFKKLGDKEEAKDVVQDTFATLWIKKNDVVFKTNLAGYLYTAVRNKIFDHIAHQEVATRYISSLQKFLDNGNAITDHLIREKQIAEMIEREIAALPLRMRIVFELSRKKYLSYKEIAEELNISEETVKDQIKKALKILRGKLGILVFIAFLLNYR